MKPSRVSKIDVGQDLRGTSLTQPSPPLPNLKELRQFVKDLRDPVNQGYGGFNARAADLIDSILSERDEARNNALEDAARVAESAGDLDETDEDIRDFAYDIAIEIRAMRGNADE